LPFRLELLRAGFNQRTARGHGVHVEADWRRIDRDSRDVRHGRGRAACRGQCRCRCPGSASSATSTPRVWDEFLCFRARATFAPWRKSAVRPVGPRVAINTAEGAGEEFPAFTHFWIERPSARAESVVIDALLESDSTTGATVHVTPGVTPSWTSNSPVSAHGRPRRGIAPLTSMFLFDETNRGRSTITGRKFMTRTDCRSRRFGEHIFRQLANPPSSRCRRSPRIPAGFRPGAALRRSERLPGFRELVRAAPSAWWSRRATGPGGVELVEIPSGRESNDNIVAFWRPAQGLQAGHPVSFAYKLTWLAEPALRRAWRGGCHDPVQPRRQAPRLHPGHRRRGRKTEGLRSIRCLAGKISNVSLVSNSAFMAFRASFELDPAIRPDRAAPAILRGARLPFTETWLYRWTSI